jgi:acylphosphatase
MPKKMSLSITIYGRVQGVFFRDFVQHHATILQLTGYVQNLSNGNTVEILAEGPIEKLNELIGHVKVGPSAAKVEDVMITWSDHTGQYTIFEVKY